MVSLEAASNAADARGAYPGWLLRSYRLELQMNVRSGIQIRDQAALQPGYGVFEQQLALFEPGEAQMIRADIICKAEDGRIEITVLLTQLGDTCKQWVVRFVVHRVNRKAAEDVRSLRHKQSEWSAICRIAAIWLKADIAIRYCPCHFRG